MMNLGKREYMESGNMTGGWQTRVACDDIAGEYFDGSGDGSGYLGSGCGRAATCPGTAPGPAGYI